MTGSDDDILVLHEATFCDDANRILSFLEKRGTFRFPTLTTGLFSAAAGEGHDFELTGYQSVWVRDNIHIAHAHLAWGEPDQARTVLKALSQYFQQHRHRFSNVIEGRSDASDPMHRPHIRFDGNRLLELPEKWSHAQNDALGAFLWLYCKTLPMEPRPEEWCLLAEFVHFFKTIRY